MSHHRLLGGLAKTSLVQVESREFWEGLIQLCSSGFNHLVLGPGLCPIPRIP